MNNDLIALFELTLNEGEVKIVHEKHYKLVAADQVAIADLEQYQSFI